MRPARVEAAVAFRVAHPAGPDPVDATHASQLLGQSQSGPRNLEQGILLLRIHCDPVLIGAGSIDELDFDSRPHSFQMAVKPHLEGIGVGSPPTFFELSLIGSPLRVLLESVRFPEQDIDHPPVGSPALDTGMVFVVGVGNAAIVLFLELVDGGPGVEIPAEPELLDEVVLFLAGREIVKNLSLVC